MGNRVLYQCAVSTKVQGELRIGPMFDRQEPAEAMCMAINKRVAEGKEKNWREARIIQIMPVNPRPLDSEFTEG
ncbi:MAG TPA: hypothetical protein VGM15_03250 [Burkholderiaceae bacterium]|jgi:hypothetical protein